MNEQEGQIYTVCSWSAEITGEAKGCFFQICVGKD